MLLFSTLCTIGIGWCLGGRLSRFERAGLAWLFLPLLAVLLQVVFTRLSEHAFTPVLLLFSYFSLFIFLWHNRHLLWSVLFLGLGSLCNLVVIVFNQFHMPVSERALSALSAEGAAALLSGEIPMYRVAESSTNLLFLGDIFWFPIPFFRGFASVGDILLCIGIFFLLMSAMGPTRLISRGKREAPPAAALRFRNQSNR